MNRDKMPLKKPERIPRKFTNSDNKHDAWFYAGRGTFYFYSTFPDSPNRCIAVRAKLLIKALTDIGLVKPVAECGKKEA